MSVTMEHGGLRAARAKELLSSPGVMDSRPDRLFQPRRDEEWELR